MHRLQPAQTHRTDELLWLALPPLFVTLALWQASPNEILLEQAAAALLLSCLPWWSYRAWQRSSGAALPVFAAVSAAYWLYFVLPLFIGDRLAYGLALTTPTLVFEVISTVLVMVLVGLVCLWLGYRCGAGRLVGQVRLPDAPADPARWGYLRIVLLVTAPIGLVPSHLYLLGPELRQFVVILDNLVPVAAFAMLFKSYLRGAGSRLDLALIIYFCVVQMLKGLSTFWLASFLLPFLIVGLVYLDERKKIPLVPIALMVMLGLFLQVGKSAVREVYWYGAGEGGVLERASAWFERSGERWSVALEDPSGTLALDLTAGGQNRVSILNHVASVLILTPDVIPHQGMSMYSYLFVTFIPRVVWPDKPSVSEANQFYQVTYGLTEQRRLNDVSIAIGALAEGYIAFGWPGVVGAMFFIGLVLDVFRCLLLRPSAGMLAQGVGFALLPQLLTVDLQMAAYLAGLPQQIFIAFLVLSPVVWGNKLLDRRRQTGELTSGSARVQPQQVRREIRAG